MYSHPGFSFIIPSFNAESTLGLCIEHIRKQKYPQQNIEVIVVDNGSSDSSKELAAELSDHWYEDPEATIAGIRNIGAQHARNPILVFVDADCLLPDVFAKVVNELFEDRLVAMAGAKTHILPEDAGWVANTWKVHLDRSQLNTQASWLVTRSLAVRTSAFREVGGFDENIETCEDVSFGHSIGENWKIVSDERLAPLHLEDADNVIEFFKKEIWRAQNSIQISWQWIKERPQLLLSKEGVSLVLPFYFLATSVLVFLGGLSMFATGSAIALLFALAAFLAPIATLSIDTARRANRMDSVWRLALLYTLYILARVVALFSNGGRTGPRRVV